MSDKSERSPDVLVLCGGQGTRLRSVVADRPKALADIAGRPFLDILSEELSRNGLRRQVLCVGYGGAQIAARYAGRAGADFKISLEDTPLGLMSKQNAAVTPIREDVEWSSM